MKQKKVLFLVFLWAPVMVNLNYPALADDRNSANKTQVELIQLDASYDTNYKMDADGAKSDTVTNHQLSFISLRKIVPVIFDSSIDSKTVRIGDQVIARLKEDLYYGKQVIAPQNSILKGSVISYRGARTLSDATFHKEDRLKSSSAIGIRFNELVIDKDKFISLIGTPVHQESFWQGADGYPHGLCVDYQGRIVEAGRTLTKDQRDSYNVLRVASNAPVPGGLFLNAVAAPVVMGAVGAASPDLAFNKPLDHETKNKRLKGMAYGFVTNLPGAFFVQAVVQKGNEVTLNSGDEFLIDLTINNFKEAQAAAAKQGNAPTEILAVQGQVLDPEPKVRLLPASLTPYAEDAHELALKSFIPNSD